MSDVGIDAKTALPRQSDDRVGSVRDVRQRYASLLQRASKLDVSYAVHCLLFPFVQHLSHLAWYSTVPYANPSIQDPLIQQRPSSRQDRHFAQHSHDALPHFLASTPAPLLDLYRSEICLTTSTSFRSPSVKFVPGRLRERIESV
jgi:hypothetical protein